jgi:hypothetical protein
MLGSTARNAAQTLNVDHRNFVDSAPPSEQSATRCELSILRRALTIVAYRIVVAIHMAWS